MSRTQAKKNLNLDEFITSMNGIFSTSVGKSTLDEAPGAYKPAQIILDAIAPTAKIVHSLKPVYSLKA
jgi:RNA-splicing ligase RtcB